MVFRKGNVPWNIGIPCPKDIKQKISNTLKNNISLERRKEMSEIEKVDKNHFYGKHHSKKTKLKMSEANKGENHPNYGKHYPEEAKLKIGKGNKGKIFSEESKKKMSESHKGIPTWNQGGIPNPKIRGFNNPNWNGGITPLAEQIRKCFKYRQWRDDVFMRDEFTWQDCGIKGGELNAHHIKRVSVILRYYEITTLEEALECAELWNINNGVTFCEECHKKLHCIIKQK